MGKDPDLFTTRHVGEHCIGRGHLERFGRPSYGDASSSDVRSLPPFRWGLECLRVERWIASKRLCDEVHEHTRSPRQQQPGYRINIFPN